VSGAARSSPNDKADLAAVAASKALRVQRDQAAAMVALIEQASAPAGDIGRIISVRA
jgi:hypothetical protein